MELQLLNHVFEIDEAILNIAKLRSLYKKYSNVAKEDIINQYYDFGSMRNAGNGLPIIGRDIIDEYINKSVEIIVKMGAYKINRDIFLSYTNAYDIWNDSCSFALATSFAIERNVKEQVKELNTYNREGSSIGNGRLGFNKEELAILNIVNQNILIETNEALEREYRSPRTVGIFAEGIERAVFNLFNTILYVLESAGISDFCTLSEESLEEAKTIFGNIGFVEDKEELIVEVIQLNPFADYAISYAFENGIGNQEEIKEYARVLELEIKPIKNITKVEKMLLYTNYTDLNELENNKKVIDDICDEYNIDRSRYDELLTDKIEKIRNELMFYDGVLYSTVEDSLEAKEVLNSVAEELMKTDETDRKVLEESINRLESSKLLTKDKYLNYLQNALDKANENAKMVFNVKFNDEEYASRNREKCKEIFDFLKEKVFNDVDELEKYKETIKMQLDEQLIGTYSNRINSLIDLFSISNQLNEKYQNYSFQNKLEETEVVIDIDSVFNAMKKLNLKNENFNLVHDRLVNQYLEVYNIHCDTIDEAIKKYVNLVKHAKAYKKSIEEKKNMNFKKGFFNAIKSGVSSVWNSQYESDYKIVTNNESNPLPNISEEMLGKINELRGQAKETFNQKLEKIEKNKITDPFDVPKNKLDILSLLDNSKQTQGQESFDVVSAIDKLLTFDLKKEATRFLNNYSEDVFSEVEKYLQGSVLQIRNKNVDLSNRQVRNNSITLLKSLNEYYFEDKDDDAIYDEFVNNKPYYIITYKYLHEIEDIIHKFNQMNITIGLVK